MSKQEWWQFPMIPAEGTIRYQQKFVTCTGRIDLCNRKRNRVRGTLAQAEREASRRSILLRQAWAGAWCGVERAAILRGEG